MANTGYILPQSAVTASENPWSDNDWTTPENIYGAGTANITAANYDANDQSYVLKAYNFDLSAIPDGSTIDGVLVRINGYYDDGANSIDLVQLLDVSRAKVGDNKASTPQALTTGAANYVFGAVDNLWSNALTSAWVKDADFGVAVGCLATGANSDVFIDSVEIDVYYTAPAGTPHTATPADTQGLADSIKISVGNKLADSEDIIDGGVALKVGNVLSDNVGTADSVKFSVGNKLADSLGITDNFSKVSEFKRSLSDTVGIADSPSMNFGLKLSDSFGISDSIEAGLSFKISLSDTVSLSDELVNGVGLGLSDPFGITDGFEKTSAFKRSLSDTFGIADGFEKVSAFKENLSDTLGIADSLVTLFGLSLNDSIAISDSVEAGLSFKISLDDTVDLSDGLANDIGLSLSDALTFADSLTKTSEFYKSLLESLNISDSFSKVSEFKRSLSDILLISDLYTDVFTSDSTINYLSYDNFNGLNKMVTIRKSSDSNLIRQLRNESGGIVDLTDATYSCDLRETPTSSASVSATPVSFNTTYGIYKIPIASSSLTNLSNKLYYCRSAITIGTADYDDSFYVRILDNTGVTLTTTASAGYFRGSYTTAEIAALDTSGYEEGDWVIDTDLKSPYWWIDGEWQ